MGFGFIYQQQSTTTRHIWSISAETVHFAFRNEVNWSVIISRPFFETQKILSIKKGAIDKSQKHLKEINSPRDP